MGDVQMEFLCLISQFRLKDLAGKMKVRNFSLIPFVWFRKKGEGKIYLLTLKNEKFKRSDAGLFKRESENRTSRTQKERRT